MSSSLQSGRARRDVSWRGTSAQLVFGFKSHGRSRVVHADTAFVRVYGVPRIGPRPYHGVDLIMLTRIGGRRSVRG